jgi:RHS repeat-associated protein
MTNCNITTDQPINLNWYDYGARFYDAQIGRFHTLDRNAERYWMQTPYCYAANSPIRLVNKDGDGPGDAILGFIAAVTDNATGGVLNLRGIGYDPATASAEAIDDFNSGLVSGDAFSIALGDAMQKTGITEDGIAGGMALAGVEVEISTVGGGTVVVVVDEALAGLVALEGLGLIAEGSVINQMAQLNMSRGSGQRKGPKNLVEEAKVVKGKKEAATERQAQRETQTVRGNNRTGKNNQDTRGSHSSMKGGNKGDMHSNAEARRAREQKKADEQKKKKS